MDMKELIQNLRPDLQRALDEVGKRHGVTLRAGNATYDPAGSFNMRLLATVAGGLSQEQSRYDANAGYLGLPPRGTVIKGAGGRSYTIAGMKGSKVQITRDDGRPMVGSVETVKGMISRG